MENKGVFVKVSFLITYYNQKEYVRESIQSVLKIRKENIEWEILVGDDGSTDGTIEEIDKYVQHDPEHIKLFVMPREEGKKYFSVQRASQNRLNLLSHATGDLFCTLDGDDFYSDSEFLMDAIRVFEQNPDVSIVGFGYRYYKDGTYGDSFTLPAGENERRVDTKAYLRAWYLHAGACVHRKCFDNNRIEYLQRIGYFDDNNIVVNSLNYGEMFAINRVIYAYRQTGKSVYTSMNALEQAILNVQGLDVDIELVYEDGLKSILMKRYASSLILMFIWKSQIREILGNEKCKQYEDGCYTLTSSYCYNLLKYEHLSEQQKNTLGIELRNVISSKVFYTIKQALKYWLREMLK